MTAQNLPIQYLAIAPEIALVILLFVVLGYNTVVGEESGRTAGLITAWGSFLVLIFTAALSYLFPATQPELLWGGMIRHDLIGAVFRVMFLIALTLTTLISLDTVVIQKAEFFALLIMATIGFNLMSVSADLIMLLVSLETASISLYLLAGFVNTDSKSAEAGIKYFIYGAFASALMMYGMSLLYGMTETTNIYTISQMVASIPPYINSNASLLNGFNGMMLLIAILFIAGFAFKISAVPFHWWAPDVYEGAPTSVTAFASTASKAAGFAVLFRLFTAGALGSPVPSSNNLWWVILTTICIATMIFGNLLAIYQSNIKRMLAYSSIAQAGYVLIGLVALPNDLALRGEGLGASLFYLLMYIVTNIAAFGVIILISNVTGSEEMKDLYGLSRRSPALAIAFLIALLSLGGIPPSAGFFGKFFLFRSAINAGYWWLALIGILAAFISLYYYLSVVKYIYLYRTEDEAAIPVSRPAQLAIVLSVFGIVYLGIISGPAFEWTQTAAKWFFW